MKVSPLNCPNCGAPLVLIEGKPKCFCTNCGTQVFVDDGQIYVNINTTQTIIKKEIKETIDRGKEADADKVGSRMTVLMFFLFVVMAIFFAIWERMG